ncbi:MAG: bifunctional proline dehydrogenase/L-glutamate gamma-semialdehyde dehydrogenase [Rhodospirillaceae bacterium]|nr:bifunctional proline dehydrogenase/L-glutamate gamma-semialdehyde dehydrogenase [Rhodospirillaceae bacterium]
MQDLQQRRLDIGEQCFVDEAAGTNALTRLIGLDDAARRRIGDEAAAIVRQLRAAANPGLMEQFLAEYGLSTREGIALMTLAEAFLRTPDALTLDELIRDKIGSGDWDSHRASGGTLLISASTWALMLTGRVLAEEESYEAEFMETVHAIIRRLGEPVVRAAVEQSMRILGQQFVLGRDIGEALKKAAPMEARGWLYSYDMLGEAACTTADATRYFQAYANAISALSAGAASDDCNQNPGISVKLSALHPRYEYVQRERVMAELVPAVSALTLQARAANIGFSIDAEEMDRLELSLDVIEAVLQSPALAGWHGFGAVVQTYCKQAMAVIDWLYELARGLDRRIAVRLVKGSYWDSEIKHAQVLGLENYPVFTRKAHTDLSYIAAAARLFEMSDRIYPQFATHNAHTASAVLEMGGARGGPGGAYEFQRLHGMSEALHEILAERTEIPSRIYAPVGVHKDLLAYLVRRLLENGANSSFVHRLLDADVPVTSLVADPVIEAAETKGAMHPRIPLPTAIFAPERENSKGIDLNNPFEAGRLDKDMSPFRHQAWKAAPGAGGAEPDRARSGIVNPALAGDIAGSVVNASADDVAGAVENASQAFPAWCGRPVSERAGILEETARLFEAQMPELIALAVREAGKTRHDGILEVREAVDFCRYYAAGARKLLADSGRTGVGPVACISPWNFPLAIFTGQVAAALATGNTVIAKPAEQTPLMAARAVELMHQAGVPKDALILLPGDGAEVGGALTSDPGIKGVAFTGSVDTACLIDRNLAEYGAADAFLIAETGGLNAMIVDSTALPEQAVRDIVASAYQSAGQRCSALRILAVQEDIEGSLLAMLEGAAHELRIGDPWDPATDVGPVIDAEAKAVIEAHSARMTEAGRLLFQVPLPEAIAGQGTFVAPAAFRLDRLEDLEREIFGPVLHVVSFAAGELDTVVDAINQSGYGLTLGIHSRVDTRVMRICRRARVGNIYVNRNQIGAVVGAQPFGGRGLSGTGPKAGGPHYLRRFTRPAGAAPPPDENVAASGAPAAVPLPLRELCAAQMEWAASPGRGPLLRQFADALPADLGRMARDVLARLAAFESAPAELHGVTGERNIYSLEARGIFLCLGGGDNTGETLVRQSFTCLATGNGAVVAENYNAEAARALAAAAIRARLPGQLLVRAGGDPISLASREGLAGIAFDGGGKKLRDLRIALAELPGARRALLRADDGFERFMAEKLVSTDTTAAGGNATLLAEAG